MQYIAVVAAASVAAGSVAVEVAVFVQETCLDKRDVFSTGMAGAKGSSNTNIIEHALLQ